MGRQRTKIITFYDGIEDFSSTSITLEKPELWRGP